MLIEGPRNATWKQLKLKMKENTKKKLHAKEKNRGGDS